MTDTVDNLVLDLLEWLGTGPRPYPEVLDAWRTSCPRLPVWEEANDRGFIERHRSSGIGQSVSVSEAGAEHLRRQRSPTLPDPDGSVGSGVEANLLADGEMLGRRRTG